MPFRWADGRLARRNMPFRWADGRLARRSVIPVSIQRRSSSPPTNGKVHW